MNHWNKLLYTLTGCCLLDPQRLQDLYDKNSRLAHERAEALDACHALFKESQTYLETLAKSLGLMDIAVWEQPASKQVHEQAALAWLHSPILKRYHFPIELRGDVYTWIHPLALYPPEARLELSRFGVIHA